MNRSRSLIIIGLVLFIGMVIGMIWGNYQFAAKKIGGEGFFVQWIGVRGLVTEGNSPYSDLTTDQIRGSVSYLNSFIEGSPIKYNSPLFSGVVVIPFALIQNKILAHALWLTAQLIAIFFIILIGLKITGWKPPWYIFFLFSILTIFSFHVFIPWLDGGLSIWVALFMVIAFQAIFNQRNEVAGFFLALTAIQPQMTILVIVFTIIWAASKRKNTLLLWFFMTLISFSIIFYFLVPGWIMQYLKLIYNFSENFPMGNPGVLFKNIWPGLGKQLEWILIGISVVILMIEWFLAIRKDFRWFLWTACLTMVISQWIGIPIIPGNFIGLILPLILVSALLAEHLSNGGQWISVFLALILFFWEWAIFLIDLNGPQPGMQLNLLLPLPLILIIGLYWVRWWAIKPKQLLIEELRLGETN